MGAWGHGYFEDDAALDLMADIEDSDNPKKVIRQAFETAIKAKHLESDKGSAVIVAATYVDGKVNGNEETDEIPGTDSLSVTHKKYRLTDKGLVESVER